MSIPKVTTSKSQSGKSYRVSLCSHYTLGRKREYFLLEELRRERGIERNFIQLVDVTERGAEQAFKNHVRQREIVEANIGRVLGALGRDPR